MIGIISIETLLMPGVEVGKSHLGVIIYTNLTATPSSSQGTKEMSIWPKENTLFFGVS